MGLQGHHFYCVTPGAGEFLFQTNCPFLWGPFLTLEPKAATPLVLPLVFPSILQWLMASDIKFLLTTHFGCCREITQQCGSVQALGSIGVWLQAPALLLPQNYAPYSLQTAQSPPLGLGASGFCPGLTGEPRGLLLITAGGPLRDRVFLGQSGLLGRCRHFLPIPCVCVCVCVCARAHTHTKLLQLCPTLQPRGLSPPDSSIHGILQERILQ